jgi:glycosyltransferase involved in cell wall biosynthesis
VPLNEVPAWADAIVSLLRDEPRRKQMAGAGLTKAARFAWPNVAQEVIAVYRWVLGC